MGFDCMYRIISLWFGWVGVYVCFLLGERERDRGAPQSSQQQLRRHSLRWCSPAEFHHQIASREREKRVHFEFFYSFTRQLGSFFIFTISALGGRWRTSCVRCGAIHVPDHILSALYTGNVCMYTHTHERLSIKITGIQGWKEESLFQSFSFSLSLRAAPDTHHHSPNVMIIRAFLLLSPALL
jgi:hypothetical protein